MNASLFQPFYPLSGVYRMIRDADHLQVDFMVKADGVNSFEGLKARSTPVDFDGAPILVASIRDIIKSKTAAGRLKDKADLAVIHEALAKKAKAH